MNQKISPFHIGSYLKISVLILFLSSHWLYGQSTANQDSLVRKLQSFSYDQQKVQYLKEQIDKFYQTEPQLAIRYADLADSLLANMDSLGWRIELMIPKAIAYRSIGENQRALDILEQALQWINPNDTSLVIAKHQASIYYSQGVIARRMGNIQEAISLSLKAIHIIDSLLQGNTSDASLLNVKSSTLEGLGNAYSSIGQYDNALLYFRQSLATLYSLDDHAGIASSLGNIGAVMYQINQLDSAEHYFSKSIELGDTTQQPHLLRNYYHNMAAIAVKREHWPQALSFFRKSLHILEQNNYQDGMAHVHESMAYTYIQMQDYQSAEGEAHKAASLVKDDLETKIAIQDDFAKIYKATGQFEKALYHREQYTQFQDSLLNQEKAEAIAEMEARFQHEQQQQKLELQYQEIKLLNQRNKIRQLERNLLALGCLFLLIIGFWIIRMQRQKMKRKQEQLANSRTLMTSIKENAQLKEQRLRQELEHRNQQLTSYTLNFIQKNELMSELRNKVEELQKQKQWTSRDFRQLKMHIQQHVSIDQDWENFKLHFESVHPDFFHNLNINFPDLGPKERKLCALIRLSLNIKESAVVLGISPDSVKTARHRLRKKMNLSYDESIQDVLMQVERGTYVSVEVNVSQQGENL